MGHGPTKYTYIGSMREHKSRGNLVPVAIAVLSSRSSRCHQGDMSLLYIGYPSSYLRRSQSQEI